MGDRRGAAVCEKNNLMLCLHVATRMWSELLASAWRVRILDLQLAICNW